MPNTDANTDAPKRDANESDPQSTISDRSMAGALWRQHWALEQVSWTQIHQDICSVDDDTVYIFSQRNMRVNSSRDGYCQHVDNGSNGQGRIWGCDACHVISSYCHCPEALCICCGYRSQFFVSAKIVEVSGWSSTRYVISADHMWPDALIVNHTHGGIFLFCMGTNGKAD